MASAAFGRGRRNTSEAWLRRSCMSSAQNAGKVAFFGFEVQPSAEIARVHRTKCW